MCYCSKVHLELAKYNEAGRFSDEPDIESALFHLEKAAMCGVTEAILTMAEIYLDLPHEMISSASVQVQPLVAYKQALPPSPPPPSFFTSSHLLTNVSLRSIRTTTLGKNAINIA